jgi:methionine-rich copper-binding protein CopC
MYPWKVLVGCFLGLTILFIEMAAFPPFAWSHAVLIESDPPHEATLQVAPETFLLRFNAALEQVITQVYLVDPDKNETPLEKVDESKTDRILVRVPPLSPGVYTIHYKVLARDGHVTEGRVLFTLLGP